MRRLARLMPLLLFSVVDAVCMCSKPKKERKYGIKNSETNSAKANTPFKCSSNIFVAFRLAIRSNVGWKHPPHSKSPALCFNTGLHQRHRSQGMTRAEKMRPGSPFSRFGPACEQIGSARPDEPSRLRNLQNLQVVMNL